MKIHNLNDLRLQLQEKVTKRINITDDERKAVYKLQATLIAIDQQRDVWFNITLYERLGLVRTWGKTIDNKTRWILTGKGRRMAYASVPG